MAETRKKQNYNSVRRKPDRYYIDGNTAREYKTKAKNKYEQRPEHQEAVKPVYIYQRRVAVFDIRYTLFLVLTCALMMVMLFAYMNSKLALSRLENEISRTETAVMKMQDQNSAAADSMNQNVDLEEIYKIATQKLGMVYATEDQIEYYDSSNSDYIRQYESIPEK